MDKEGIKRGNHKRTLWIPSSQLNIYILSSLHSGIIAYFGKKKPWHMSMVMSAAGLSLLYATKWVDQSRDRKGDVIGKL